MTIPYYSFLLPSRICTRRRGGSLLLVLIAVTVGFSLTTAYLFVIETTSGSTLAALPRSQATQIAESGIDIARVLIRDNDSWLLDIEHGTLINGMSLLGGELTVTTQVLDTDLPPLDTIEVSNPSFETGTWQLSNPVLSAPPMSGAFGSWSVTRTAAVATGLTVPHVGTMNSSHASDGQRIAYVSFGISVAGSAQFSQILTDGLQPGMTYHLRVDVGTAGLATVLSAVRVQVVAGSTTIASSDNPSLLTILDLGNGLSEYSIRFTTPNPMPDGSVRIQLSSEAIVGLVSAVAFDNVRLEAVPDPTVQLQIRSLGVFGRAQRVIEARAVVQGGPDTRVVRIVQWSD